MLKPFDARVMVKKPERQEQTESGIILPDTAQDKPQEGKVLAVGDCVSVKKDDLVLYPKYTGTEITHEGQDILIMSEKEILAVVG